MRFGPEKYVPPKGRSSAALRAGADFGATMIIKAMRQRRAFHPKFELTQEGEAARPTASQQDGENPEHVSPGLVLTYKPWCSVVVTVTVRRWCLWTRSLRVKFQLMRP